MKPRGVRPRRTRDNRLGLADYVRFSLTSQTPLLADKLAKGFPHALFVFDGAAVFALPGVALLPYNTKAWRHRSAFSPVIDAERQQKLLRDFDAGRFRSLEILAPYGVGLDALTRCVFVNSAERDAIAEVLDALGLTLALAVEPSKFPACPDYSPTTFDAVAAYFSACMTAKNVLPTPEMPLTERWQQLVRLGETYGVDPRVFAVLYVAHHPLFWGTMAFLAARVRRKRPVRPLIFAAVFFWLMPYLYVFAFGRGLPWWTYALAGIALLVGGTHAAREIKKRLKPSSNASE